MNTKNLVVLGFVTMMVGASALFAAEVDQDMLSELQSNLNMQTSMTKARDHTLDEEGEVREGRQALHDKINDALDTLRLKEAELRLEIYYQWQADEVNETSENSQGEGLSSDSEN